MKRILMVLAVAALMVAMMVAMAAPAFADRPWTINPGFENGGLHHGYKHGQQSQCSVGGLPDTDCGLHNPND